MCSDLVALRFQCTSKDQISQLILKTCPCMSKIVCCPPSETSKPSFLYEIICFFHIKTDNSWSSRHLICIESRPQSEVRWRSGWSQNPSCGHLLVQKTTAKPNYSSDIAVQNLLLSPQKLCIPTSMHPSCSKYEIIRFFLLL